MKSNQTIITQKKAFDNINAKIHQNANFMNELINSIQNNDIKRFNRLTNKNVNSIESAKGYIRLYNGYLSSQTNISSKSKSQMKISSSSSQTIQKQSKQKIVKKSFNLIDVSKLHPFKSVMKNEILSFTLFNQNSVLNSNYNIKKIYDFINLIKFRIDDFNLQSKKPIKFVRLSVQYKATDNSTRFFSTQKSDINSISNAIRTLFDSLLTYNPTWYMISPKNVDFIDDLSDKTFHIYSFSEIKLTYYLK